MTIFLTIFGLALVAVAMTDIFATLFHPAGRGALSDHIEFGVWCVVRQIAQRRPSFITLGGPFIFVSIIVTWALLFVFGFALIFAPHMATQFALAPGLDPARHHSFTDAFNVSLGALVTLGGDFNSRSKLLRFAMGAEGVIGFGLLSASVSWLLSIYPLLEQRRSLSQRLTLLHHAETESGERILDLPEQDAFTLLMEFAGEFAQLRNSASQFPITYYFHSGETISGLAGILEYARVVADEASRSGSGSVRLAGTCLGGAIEDYLKLIAVDFLRMPPKSDTRDILRAYASDHMREVVNYDPYGAMRRAS
jgi:hypothetical protein